MDWILKIYYLKLTFISITQEESDISIELMFLKYFYSVIMKF